MIHIIHPVSRHNVIKLLAKGDLNEIFIQSYKWRKILVQNEVKMVNLDDSLLEGDDVNLLSSGFTVAKCKFFDAL